MEEKKLLLIGGGGHCRSILDCILTNNTYQDIGIIDKNISSSILGIPVIGTDDDLSRLKDDGWTDAFISLGSIESTDVRRKLYQLIFSLGFSVPIVIDRSAIIAKEVIIEKGSFIGKRTVINTGARIGSCAIINTGCIIEHDCVIGDFSHISPGTVLCGQVTIGDDTHVGAGSVVRQCITIGHNTLIGAGSVVVSNISSNAKAFGNPCRVVV